jgi:GT2 family glycosyltransferase
MSDQPIISVIVPVYNGGDKFRQCLDSIQALSPAPDQVIVVADGDTDGSRDLARQYGATVITREQPGGPARARNLGAEVAHGDVLFFVDADVTVHSDAIHKLRHIFATKNDVTAVFGSYDDAPSEANFVSQFKNLMHHYVHQASNEEAATFWGACGAVRREAFTQLGGFDEERYDRPCIEDIEFGYRLKAAGYQIRLVKTLYVKHLKKWTVVSQIKTDVLDRALPWTQLMLEQDNLSNDLNLQWSSRISTILVYLLILAVPLAVVLPLLLNTLLPIVIVLLYLNASLYGFFLYKRGTLFTVRAVLWHWVYYLYSGAAFGVASFQHIISVRSKPNTRGNVKSWSWN